MPETTNGPEAAADAQAAAGPVTVEVTIRIKALAVPEPCGGYSVVVPALPGCFTQGDDIEEVKANLVEVAELWLEVYHDQRRDEALRSTGDDGRNRTVYEVMKAQSPEPPPPAE